MGSRFALVDPGPPSSVLAKERLPHPCGLQSDDQSMTGLRFATDIVGALRTSVAIVRDPRHAVRTLRSIEQDVGERGHRNATNGDVQAKHGGARRLHARTLRGEYCVNLVLMGNGTAISAASSTLRVPGR